MRRTSEVYYDLFKKAAAESGGVLIPLTPTEAKNLRSYLYHFRCQLRESQPDFIQGDYEKLKFTIEPRGLRISIPPAPGGEAIHQALS